MVPYAVEQRLYTGAAVDGTVAGVWLWDDVDKIALRTRKWVVRAGGRQRFTLNASDWCVSFRRAGVSTYAKHRPSLERHNISTRCASLTEWLQEQLNDLAPEHLRIIEHQTTRAIEQAAQRNNRALPTEGHSAELLAGLCYPALLPALNKGATAPYFVPLLIARALRAPSVEGAVEYLVGKRRVTTELTRTFEQQLIDNDDESRITFPFAIALALFGRNIGNRTDLTDMVAGRWALSLEDKPLQISAAEARSTRDLLRTIGPVRARNVAHDIFHCAGSLQQLNIAASHWAYRGAPDIPAQYTTMASITGWIHTLG